METIRLCSNAGVVLATGTARMWRIGLVEVERSGVAVYLQKGDDVPVNLNRPRALMQGQFLSLDECGVLGS